MKRNIGQTRDERRENEWQDVVSDAEGEQEEGKGGKKEDAETGKAEQDSTFGIVENSTVSDMESTRTGSSILIALGTWGTSLISLLGVTPTSKQAQTIYMGFMLVLSLVPILALVIQNGTSLNEVLQLQDELILVEESVETSDDIASLVAHLQQERSEAVLTMMSNAASVSIEDIQNTGININQRYEVTDNAIESIKEWRSPPGEKIFQSKLRFQIRLDDFRKRIVLNENTSSVDLSVEDVMQFYNYATRVLLDDLSNIIRSSNGSSTWRHLISYKNMLRAIENIGVEMSLGLRFYARSELSRVNFAKFIEHQKLSIEYMKQAETFVSDLREEMDKIRNSSDFVRFTRTFTELSKVKMVNFTNLAEKKLRIFEYFESSVRLMNKLREILKDIRKDLKDIMNQEIRSVNNDFAMTMVILTIILLVSPFILMLMRNAMRAVQILSNALKSKYGDLRKEKKRSEKLLYKMLPPVVADAVKSKKKTSWLFESATVFFSEIDEFKELTRACQPLQLFELLNILYKIFDEQIDNYNVYKVETINDSYMVASGLPEKNGDLHAAEIANLAIALQSITPTIVVPHDPTRRLQIKMGIHTGATIAGVVGRTMPRYCLFGDTVNVASRMQTTGEVMKIQITYETRVLLDTLGGFYCVPRGQVEVKGKGMMDTFWLDGRV